MRSYLVPLPTKVVLLPASAKPLPKKTAWADVGHDDSDSSSQPPPPPPTQPPPDVEVTTGGTVRIVTMTISNSSVVEVGLDREAPLESVDLEWLYGRGFRACGSDATELAASNLPFIILRRKAQNYNGVGYKVDDVDAEGLFRWSWIPVLRKRSLQDDDKDVSAPLQLSLATWNAGAHRQGMISEMFRSGAFHIQVAQEFGDDDGIQADLLTKLGWKVCIQGALAAMARVHLVDRIDSIFYTTNDYLEGALFRIVLRRAILGTEVLHVGSLHLSNKKASKTTVAMQDAILAYMGAIRSHCSPDFIGFDFNQGRPAVIEALQRDANMMMGAPGLVCTSDANDCIGCCLPSGSSLWTSSIMLKAATTHNYFNPDLGWRMGDADAHWLGTIHLRPATMTGERRRKQESVGPRIARKNARRKARKHGILPDASAPSAPVLPLPTQVCVWPPRRVPRHRRPRAPRTVVPPPDGDEPERDNGSWPENGDWRWGAIPPPGPGNWHCPLPAPLYRRKRLRHE